MKKQHHIIVVLGLLLIDVVVHIFDYTPYYLLIIYSVAFFFCGYIYEKVHKDEYPNSIGLALLIIMSTVLFDVIYFFVKDFCLICPTKMSFFETPIFLWLASVILFIIGSMTSYDFADKDTKK